MIAGDPDHGMEFSLSPGNTSDYTIGRKLIREYAFPPSVSHLAMDKGYSSYEILSLCRDRGVEPVVPPKSNFRYQWAYNKNIYVYRNEIERHFNRLKNYRRIATRYDKLDFMYGSFLMLGMIALILKVIC